MLGAALSFFTLIAPVAPEAIADGMSARLIARDAYVVSVEKPFDGNTLVVAIGERDLVIVSAPYTTAATKTLLAWAEKTFGKRKITAIDPHFHLDGAGGNEALVAAGAEVWASDLTARMLVERGARRRDAGLVHVRDEATAAQIRATQIVAPTRTFVLTSGKTLAFGSETVEIAWPGPTHSPDHVVVRFPERKILFGGCLLLGGERPVNLLDADVPGWRRSMDAVERLAAGMEILVPGHGERLDRGLLENTRTALATVAIDRRVAVTVDDLPWAGPFLDARKRVGPPREAGPFLDARKRVGPPREAAPPDPDAPAAIARLAAHLTSRKIPATGFIVGGRPLAPAKAWLAAGFGLADHTLSHRAYSKMTIAEFTHEVEENGRVVKAGLGIDLEGTFFRFPFLDHGHTEAKVAAAAALMTKRRERHAPVSLDTIDYAFANDYAKAPPAARPAIAALFLAHIEEAAEHFEALSRELYDREIPLVLLVHANALEADHLGDVADLLVARGYRFVALGDALDDAAYAEYGNRPPHVKLEGDRNFLNQVALERGIHAADPTGEARYDSYWQSRIKAALAATAR